LHSAQALGVSDYLAQIDAWPAHTRAVELVHELCERSITKYLG